MKWSKEAEEAIGRVPFFVRKRVRHRIEEEARREGSRSVTLVHIHKARKRFLEDTEEEIKDFQVETCFGTAECPNRALDCSGITEELEEILSRRVLKSFLKERLTGPPKIHHELRVSLSCCPNACSRPQIADIGIIRARRPCLTDEPCSHCGACIEACREEALILDERRDRPVLVEKKCLCCGQCIRVCPSGTLKPTGKAFASWWAANSDATPNWARTWEKSFPARGSSPD